uniref:TCF3 fusion partner n=1 Tax=Myotis myotis TaxID=51298 RepID=A0A7J8ALT9_MYOMY|nr:hypothetical protein mMyoMyo1_007847 [Myotis myotis]
MELEHREGSMAAEGFEEFSAPPCLELAPPPLFGGHILESELETEVEFMSGAGPEQAPSDIEDNTETTAGAEVPHEGAGLLRGRLLGQPIHHLTGGRGQPEHRCPTPGNAENEPPEKEGLSPPRRTPAPAEASSPAPGEGPSSWKRRQVPREGGRSGVPLTPDLAPMQIKVEEDFGFKAVEALDSSWVSRGPDKLLPYPTLASSLFD